MPEARNFHVRTPLADGVLLVYRVRAREELGRPFRYDLELLSEDPQVKLEDVVGKDMTLTLHMHDNDPRYFHGVVARFGQSGTRGRYTRYLCTLRPHLWLLTRVSHSRIFQGKTVPEIVTQVLKDSGYSDVVNKLHETYQPREYCVQYRETDFDFVSRLMEEEGIYYHFAHEDQKHSMVLADERASHAPMPNYEKLPFIPPEVNARPREEHVREWTVMHEVQTGAMAVNDFDFEVPRASLLTRLSQPLEHAHNALEQYDPVAHFVLAHDAADGNSGDPKASKRGEAFARVRLEELQAEHDRGTGESNARGLAVGSLFELEDHPRGDQNREYLIVAADYRMFEPGYDAGGSTAEHEEEEPPYHVTIEAQPAKRPYRPRRLTDRPVIAGPHPATVVGSGEIWTDKFGRVKVLFPWDQLGKDDGSGSCWVRVSQLWAGSGWGGLHVPRVGQEVIVEFVEGDPDRPIITGRVYNGANLPPFGLPGGATKSGILTRSSKDGTADTANEIRFEDKKGDEQVFLHAEKDMATEVEHDQSTWVGHDRTKTVDNDQTEHVKGNKKITVDKDHTEEINQNMSLRVVKNEQENIGGNRSIDVGGSHTETIGTVYNQTVGAASAVTVGGASVHTAGAAYALNVGANMDQAVGSNLGMSIAGNTTLSTGKNLSVTVTKEATIEIQDAATLQVSKDVAISMDGAVNQKIAKTLSIEADEIMIEAKKKITLKAGDASIILDNGKIEIKGSKVQAKADGDMILKASKIAQN